MAILNGIANTAKLASQIMGYLNNDLYLINQEHAKLISFNCFEEAANVVPSKTEVSFACSLSGEYYEQLNNYLQSLLPIFKKIYPSEKDLKFSIETSSSAFIDSDVVLSESASDAVLNFIDKFIYGLVAKDSEDGRLLASSNVCPIKLDLSKDKPADEPQFSVTIYSRSEPRDILAGFAELAQVNYGMFLATLKQKGDAAEADIHDYKVSEFMPFDYVENDPLRSLVEKNMKIKVTYNLGKMTKILTLDKSRVMLTFNEEDIEIIQILDYYSKLLKIKNDYVNIAKKENET